MFVILLIALARPFLCPTCESLYCTSFIYLFPMFVILFIALARPFLSPTCESLYCASFFCLSCVPFCLVVNRGCRGEERVSDSLASWEDKRMDTVASSWRFVSTQSIISLHRPIIFPSVKRRYNHPDTDNHTECEYRIQHSRRPTNSETHTTGAGRPTRPDGRL
jgi:hypothetical protein